jgi:TM2 domain-containing membrane protein YozV
MAVKSKIVAALLCFFLGALGVHRFYLGKTGTGILQVALFVLGSILALVGIGMFIYFILGTWILIDFILILTGTLKEKQQNEPLR